LEIHKSRKPKFCLSGPYAGGDLLENPIDILTDLQVNYIGIDAESLDSEAYENARVEFSGAKCRRFIGADISTDTLIEELAIETIFDLFIVDNKYTVRSRMPWVTIDASFDEVSIKPESLRVDSDPEGLYANRIKCNYRYDPRMRNNRSITGTIRRTEPVQSGRAHIDFKCLYVHVCGALEPSIYSLIQGNRRGADTCRNGISDSRRFGLTSGIQNSPCHRELEHLERFVQVFVTTGEDVCGLVRTTRS
jgi:hypothetical protein